MAEISRQIKTIAMPRAEKLKVHVKELFATEAARSKASAPSLDDAAAAFNNDVHPIFEEDYEELKKRYNTLNENELRELMERKRREAGSSAASVSSPDPKADGNKPSFDRSLKPQHRQNSYNLRTVNFGIFCNFISLCKWCTLLKLYECYNGTIKVK